MSPLRILYLTDIRFPLERANGIQSMETCSALANRGHRVTLLVRPDIVSPPRDPYEAYGVQPVPGLTIDRVRVVGPPPLRRVCYLAAAVRRARMTRGWDVVLTRDLGVVACLVRLPSTFRPPVVYESHGFAPVFADTMPELLGEARRGSRLKRRRLMARERLVWRRADGYVTITRGLADELAGMFGARPRLAVIPDGARLRPDRRFRPPIPRATPTVGYAGHLYPWKGIDVLLWALAELPDVRGLIVGGREGDRDLPRARELAASLGIAERITFTGWIRPFEVPGTLEETADVLALPNSATTIGRRYTSPLKLFEYLALGKPIVASDLPALGEILSDGGNAVLVEPDNPHALAQGIRRVLDNPALAESIARRAFEDAPEYSWDRRAERIERLLYAVAGSRQPAAGSGEW